MPVPVSASSRTGRPSAVGADRLQVLVGQRPRDRDGQRACVVRVGDLGGGEVQPAEGAELVVRQRRHRAGDPGAVARVVRRPDLDPGQGEALGVDQLEGTRVLRRGGDVGRARQGDQAALALEAGETEGAVREELEVVELTRGRAVLRDGGLVGHRARMPHAAVRGGWLGSSRMPAPVVVAEIVRSGFVEGHHYGSVVALDADGVGGLVRGRRRPRDPAAVLQQAAPGGRHAAGRPRPRRRAARPRVGVALRRGVPPRGRPADPVRGRAGRVRAPDAAGLPDRRPGPRGVRPRRRREVRRSR